jgi:hypothetical protein
MRMGDSLLAGMWGPAPRARADHRRADRTPKCLPDENSSLVDQGQGHENTTAKKAETKGAATARPCTVETGSFSLERARTRSHARASHEADGRHAPPRTRGGNRLITGWTASGGQKGRGVQSGRWRTRGGACKRAPNSRDHDAGGGRDGGAVRERPHARPSGEN